MAQYPRTQIETAALANSMVSGFTLCPEDFPHAEPERLEQVMAEYVSASNELNSMQSQAKQAASKKQKCFSALNEEIKRQLKLAQADCSDNPVKLGEIGWAERADARVTDPPGQPLVLKITSQGVAGERDNRRGVIGLEWTKPVRTKRCFIGYYAVERRQMEPQPGPWQYAGSAIDDKVILKAEPLGVRLEYRVKTVNRAGESYPSNIVAVIL